MRAALLAVVAAVVVTACSGRSGPLGPEYEYEEDLTLALDGSATLVVNASVPALVALHGLPLNTDLRTRADQLKNDVRALYGSPYSQVVRINTWNRRGRRFVGIRLTVPDVRALPQARPFAWSKYELREQGEQVLYKHALKRTNPAAGPGAGSGWQGNELVAFRLHLPARIRFHNSRDLATDTPRQAARGNILTWEQRLTDRLEGKPIAYAEDKTPDVMEVRMDRQSILYTTLWLFGFAFLAALLVLGGLIWLTMRRGSRETSNS